MIICAAIRVDFKDIDEYVIIPCYRHSDGHSLLHLLHPNRSWNGSPEEGFLTSGGYFLNRMDAWNHAIDCGQLPAQIRYDKRGIKELYSEDLY